MKSGINRKILFLALITLMSGCKFWDNFTTYFNTYYNQDRLIFEAEDEFSYQEEKKRVTPRVFIPEPANYIQNTPKSGPPPFMNEFVIEQQKLQPVKIKLDSVVIKGSKILAKHPESNYIENTLYLMAKAYFYRSEWLPSQIKCSEQIDKFPDGDLSPDAHLLLSENMLIQKKFYAGKIMLSRTVDIAWQKKRYDILSAAFRLQADLAIFEGDLDGAIKPYKQAIAQSDSRALKAKWQVEMGAIYYRLSKFKESERAFAKVKSYSPDYLASFESELYRALSIIRQGRYDEAEPIIKKLENDGKFSEWTAYCYSARMTIIRLKKNENEFKASEKFADSAYVNNPSILSVYFERGVDAYNAKDYPTARKYFARTRNQRSPFFSASERLFYLLNSWEQKHTLSEQLTKKIKLEKARLDSAKNAPAKIDSMSLAKADSIPAIKKDSTKTGDTTKLAQKDTAKTKAAPPNTPLDTLQAMYAMNRFELGRIHEELGNADSAEIYYSIASDICPPTDKGRARYIYAYSRMIMKSNPVAADSLFELLAETYPTTDFGKEAIVKQGYTEYFVVDTVAELYNSGNSLRKSKEYNFAITQYSKVYSGFPASPYAPRSLYAVGWIYEKNLVNVDSALHYYKTLIDRYPNSEYANDVKTAVTYLSLIRNGQPIPDSLKKRERIKPVPLTPPQIKLEDPNQKQPVDKAPDPGKTEITPKDLLKDPSKIFKKAKEMINPDNLMPKINLPKNPLKMFDSKNDSTKKDAVLPDSSKKTIIPP